MKNRLRQSLLLFLFLVGSSLASSVALSQPIAALPSIYFAAPGDACALPDGSTLSDGKTPAGVVASDGHTCCPPSTINVDGSANPIRCLYAKYINPLINLLAAAVGVIVIIAIVYGAIEYITSGGDAQRVAAGKKRIIEALIGLVAFILLYSFLQFLVPGGLGNG